MSDFIISIYLNFVIAVLYFWLICGKLSVESQYYICKWLYAYLHAITSPFTMLYVDIHATNRSWWKEENTKRTEFHKHFKLYAFSIFVLKNIFTENNILRIFILSSINLGLGVILPLVGMSWQEGEILITDGQFISPLDNLCCHHDTMWGFLVIGQPGLLAAVNQTNHRIFIL